MQAQGTLMDETQNIKRPRGRPPNHPPKNQYTGVRSKNIDYVRQYLRAFLECERTKDFTLVDSQGGGNGRRDKQAMAIYYRQVILACRLLLACERVFIFGQNDGSRGGKTFERLQRLEELGKQVKAGTVGLPALLDEISAMKEPPDADF